MEKINEFYTYLNCQQTAQHYLFQCYQKIPGIDAVTKSYENCNAFMYYLDHGNRFYENSGKVDLFARPVLLFYGMIHLLKACLLTKRPSYPESTALLAHGVSARKRKRKNYTFMKDEVKVQHHGLFPYCAEHLFSNRQLPFEKIDMEKLFSLIPELNHLFTFQDNEQMVVVSTVGSRFFQFPVQLLDSYHLTASAFKKRLATHLPEIKQLELDDSHIQLELTKPLDTIDGPFYVHTNKDIYFPIDREHFLPLPEVMVHYLLLYNLSMLCRYEPEWWGDLLVTKSDIDYPFIVRFLQLTANKIPLLLGMELHQQLNKK